MTVDTSSLFEFWRKPIPNLFTTALAAGPPLIGVSADSSLAILVRLSALATETLQKGDRYLEPFTFTSQNIDHIHRACEVALQAMEAEMFTPEAVALMADLPTPLHALSIHFRRENEIAERVFKKARTKMNLIKVRVAEYLRLGDYEGLLDLYPELASQKFDQGKTKVPPRHRTGSVFLRLRMAKKLKEAIATLPQETGAGIHDHLDDPRPVKIITDAIRPWFERQWRSTQIAKIIQSVGMQLEELFPTPNPYFSKRTLEVHTGADQPAVAGPEPAGARVRDRSGGLYLG